MSNYFDTLRDVSRGITIKSKNSVDRSKVTVINSNETNTRKGIKNPVLSKKIMKHFFKHFLKLFFKRERSGTNH